MDIVVSDNPMCTFMVIMSVLLYFIIFYFQCCVRNAFYQILLSYVKPCDLAWAMNYEQNWCISVIGRSFNNQYVYVSHPFPFLMKVFIWIILSLWTLYIVYLWEVDNFFFIFHRSSNKEELHLDLISGILCLTQRSWILSSTRSPDEISVLLSLGK